MNMQMQTASHDVFGWVVIVIGTIVTAATIVASIYWLIRPGETDPLHPKRLIMRNDR